ncbi:MAG TPA: hypothetical protein VHT92_07720 [Candidatus Cybelea sp.]|nr:hypothetical protein [Candidatus Cybelea sp.]
MYRFGVALAILLASAPLSALAAANCDGPSVTSVALRTVSHTPHIDYYHVTATVTNVGSQGQPGDALQFVDVVQYGGRLDDRGVPPLAPGQSYTIDYTWPRSADAGKMTSPLDFRMRSVTPSAGSCSATKAGAGITV